MGGSGVKGRCCCHLASIILTDTLGRSVVLAAVLLITNQDTSLTILVPAGAEAEHVERRKEKSVGVRNTGVEVSFGVWRVHISQVFLIFSLLIQFESPLYVHYDTGRHTLSLPSHTQAPPKFR